VINLEIDDDKFKAYDKINFAAIKAKSKELEKYPGYLPMIIYALGTSHYNHTVFLDQKGLLDDGEGLASELAWKISKARKKSYTPDEKVDELRIWIKDNSEFKDFLIEY